MTLDRDKMFADDIKFFNLIFLNENFTEICVRGST